ncbi:uncharacterized protein [Halyomorpha halys]|uniref:uncharacterized protein n=1 Tax=Halyomorpha halys TaxID=286706 RepID=UPI0006D4E2A0|nr:uncharacterized protein LOC106687610 [Halyomorpha halys]
MMNFELLNPNENRSKNEVRNYAAITPIEVQHSKNYNISSGDQGSEACEIRNHGLTPCIDNVQIVNDDITNTDAFSCEMTVKEKLNWLEKKILGLKNLVDGNEIWMLSKDGHAMKVKCLLTTNELPECKGSGVPSAIKFLRQMKKTLISAGVTEEDWVTLASSRLRGNLRAAWEIKSKCLPRMNWSEFTDFVVNQVYRKRRFKGDDRRIMKKGHFCIEDYLLKNKQEVD